MIPIPVPSRKMIIWGIIGIVIIIAITTGINYLNTFQKVTVTYDTSLVSKLELYPAADTRGLVTTGDSTQTIESGKEYFLKKGVYALKPQGEKVDTSLIKLQLGDRPVVRSLDIDYSQQALESLLATEQDTIVKSIMSSNIGIPALYRVNQGKLYHHGEWYGSTLSYGGTEELRRDTLRVVVKKEGDTWKVMTNPPQIILSKLEYPAIPVSILQKVNSIDIGIPYVINLQTSGSDTDHID